MNFLAHLFLSGTNNDIRFGNFIGDYVKGNEIFKYPLMVQRGIRLHRKIDFFTDTHPIVKNHKALFYNKYHKYAGVIVDVLYDHYLTTNWSLFTAWNYNVYVEFIYKWIEENFDRMPKDLQELVPRLISNKWLNFYATLDGIERVFISMSKGTSLPHENEFALEIIRKHYNEIQEGFLIYFEDLIGYVNNKLIDFEKPKD